MHPILPSALNWLGKLGVVGAIGHFAVKGIKEGRRLIKEIHKGNIEKSKLNAKVSQEPPEVGERFLKMQDKSIEMAKVEGETTTKMIKSVKPNLSILNQEQDLMKLSTENGSEKSKEAIDRNKLKMLPNKKKS